jgi:ATP-dependent DNA ligase
VKLDNYRVQVHKVGSRVVIYSRSGHDCTERFPSIVQPLVKRRERLQALLERFGCPAVSLSGPFEDGLALLRLAEERGLEGVVSKRRDAPYRSRECRDWRRSSHSRAAKPNGRGGGCSKEIRPATCGVATSLSTARRGAGCSTGRINNG